MHLIDIENIESIKITDQEGNIHEVVPVVNLFTMPEADLSVVVPLELCPCCQGKAKIIHNFSELKNTPDSNDPHKTLKVPVWYVECTACGLKTSTFTRTPYRAIENWNTRPAKSKA